MFSEVTEVCDAIHLLTLRAADVSVGKRLLEEMAWYDTWGIHNALAVFNPASVT